jgi:hypothetical protein
VSDVSVPRSDYEGGRSEDPSDRRHRKKKAVTKPSLKDSALTGSAGAAGTGLGLAFASAGTPRAMLIAALPAGLKYTFQVAQYALAERNGNRVVAEAAAVLGTDEAGLTERVAVAGVGAMPLAFEVFEAVSRTTGDQKIDALARVWAHGLGHDAKPDEDLAMVRTLSAMEPGHVQLLQVELDGRNRRATPIRESRAASPTPQHRAS